MLKKALGTVRRFNLASLMLLALIFAAPGFEANACTVEGPASSADIIMQADNTNEDPACLDCGPACATHCCHASHTGLLVTPSIERATLSFTRVTTWIDTLGHPVSRPQGPERPPRA